jgi:hypothetical protein
MSKRHRENLEQFFGGYLHQNWDDFYENSYQAVAEFLSDYPRDDALEILTSLAWLLDQRLSEQELRSLLRELDNAYYPPGFGKTYKQWLIEIYNQIAEHLEKATIVYQENQKGTGLTKSPAISYPSGDSSDKKEFPISTGDDLNSVPSVEPINESSNFIGYPLIIVVLGIGFFIALYVSQMFSAEDKKAPTNTAVSSTQTSEPSKPEMQFRVIKTAINDTYREFIVVLSPGKWFDTGIPVTRDWKVKVVGERQSTSWLIQIGNQTKERPEFPREVSFSEDTVQPSDCMTIKVFAKGSNTQKLKIITQISTYTYYNYRYRPDQKAIAKANSLLAKIQSQ